MKTYIKRFSKLRLLTPLLLTHYIGLNDHYLKLIDQYFDEFERRLELRGLEDTLNYYKKVRLCFTKYLCDQPLSDLDGISMKDGIPFVIKSFVDILKLTTIKDDRVKLIRVILTLLTVGRAFKAKPVLDTSTITDE